MSEMIYLPNAISRLSLPRVRKWFICNLRIDVGGLNVFSYFRLLPDMSNISVTSIFSRSLLKDKSLEEGFSVPIS